ncbi:SGNH/GDSL hydrolase family protein [Cohnella sp.]|uniref:SGNH/GDSL hydrolase family protein n=1 Tax=Cohnella sp. TaxID=1883426 RepID=UPI003561D824
MKSKTILFQGDSITDGNRWRNDDMNLGHSYAAMIAGQLGKELAASRPRFLNRGISGDRVSDLYARWNEDFCSLKPDVLSILIGVNDAWRTVDGLASGVTDRFERAYRYLLEETREVMPDTGIIICEPFVLNTGARTAEWDKWQKLIPAYQEAARRLAEKSEAVFVPLQSAFDRALSEADASYWLYDGVHPTTAGHQLIAEAWLAVVQSSKLAVR